VQFPAAQLFQGAAELPGFRLLIACDVRGLGKTVLRFRVIVERHGHQQFSLDAV